MSAAQIASALGDARREGRGWRCCCPLHSGRSLVIKDGDWGRVLVKCWGGCNSLDVLAELSRCGLLPGRATYTPRVITVSRRHDDGARTARTLKIWRESRVGAGSVAARYLASRGIRYDRWPDSLRLHPNCPRPRDGAGKLLTPQPAMVALVEHVERGSVGVHCTYLRPDGSAKADLPKNEQRAFFGPILGGANPVRRAASGRMVCGSRRDRNGAERRTGMRNASLGCAVCWRDQKSHTAARGGAHRDLC